MDLLFNQEIESHSVDSKSTKSDPDFCLKLLPGITSTESSSPDELALTGSPTSSDEFYQTFIEGDLGSPLVAPKLNLNTHPVLMKSESEPINIRYSYDGGETSDSDEIILPSPIKKEDTSGVFDFDSVTGLKCFTLKDNLSSDETDQLNCTDTEQDSVVDCNDQSILSSDKSQKVPDDINAHSDRDSGVVTEIVNRDSDVSLMSMDSELSRFSYSDLPGMDLSFVNGNSEVTEF